MRRRKTWVVFIRENSVNPEITSVICSVTNRLARARVYQLRTWNVLNYSIIYLQLIDSARFKSIEFKSYLVGLDAHRM